MAITGGRKTRGKPLWLNVAIEEQPSATEDWALPSQGALEKIEIINAIDKWVMSELSGDPGSCLFYYFLIPLYPVSFMYL
jgi:hypothetical protein